MAINLKGTGRALAATVALVAAAPAMAGSAPFIIEGAGTAPAVAAVPVLRTSSVVTLGDDTVTQNGVARLTPAAFNAVPVTAAPVAPTVTAPALPTVMAPPLPAAPVIAPSAPQAAMPLTPPMAPYVNTLDRRSYKRALKEKRAYERALRRCGSECRVLLAQGPRGHGHHMGHGPAYAPMAYYAAPMQAPAPVVTRGEVPGMAGATWVQTQYAGQYANGYYYPGETVTKITIDPGTVVVTPPAPTVTTYYAKPSRAATPRRAKVVRYRTKLIRR